MKMDLRVEDRAGGTCAVVRVGRSWRCAYVGGRWSVISVVLGEGGLVNTPGNWITDYGFERDLEGGGDIYAR